MRERGGTLLELTVGLAIFGLILASVAGMLGHSLRAKRRVEAISRTRYTELRLASLFQNGMDRLDTHRLPLEPRMHTRGQVLFADGSPNPVMSSRSRPAADSDAITFHALAPLAAMKLELLQDRAFKACPRWDREALSGEPQLHGFDGRYLGVSAGGMSEMEEISRRSLPDGCARIEARAGRSMIASSPVVPAELLLLVPLLDSYTLYLDSTGQLRRLSHRLSENIENQPLAEGIEHLQLELYNREGFCELRLSAGISGRYKHLWFRNRLARNSALNLLLNRP